MKIIHIDNHFIINIVLMSCKHLTLLFFLILATSLTEIKAQCCSGGSSNPIAGGTSQGVLEKNQIEINFNHQLISSDKFLSSDTLAPKFLENYNSNYSYSRLSYGLTKSLTFSIESGYYFNKTEVQLNHTDTINSGGISDLVLFPRYSILNNDSGNCNTSIVIGIGSKIPLGSYNDSVLYFTNPKTGKEFYQRKPPGIQATSGANDFIFYGFFFRGFPMKKFSVFSSAIYIRKGWNPDGEKLGDFVSLGIFFQKRLVRGLNSLIQVKGEYIGMTKRNAELPFPNYIVEYSGSRKLLIVPQLLYSFKNNLSIYSLAEIPLYQKVNGTQIATKLQGSAGVSYKFGLSLSRSFGTPKERDF